MYTQEDVKKVQARLLEMAKAIRDVLEAHNIPYFITYGTLLGAVRHQGFIPWDDDFDFYLFDDTYDMAIEVLRAELPEGLFVEDAKSEPKYFHGWAHVKDMNSYTECELFPQDGCYAHKGISVDLYRTKKIFEAEEQVYRLIEHKKYLIRRKNVQLIEEDVANSRLTEIESKLSEEELKLKSNSDKGREMYAFMSFYNDRIFVEEMYPLKKYTFEDTEFYGPYKGEALLERCYHDFMQLPPEDKRHPHYSFVKFM